ncbi:MAG: efflux RND transporter periplasmic adaptor subunit [bacterium]|nr:efflux RND transporter periplasmic adaptor subunit [bacterium]
MRRGALVVGALVVLGVLWALFATDDETARPRYVVEEVDRGPITATVTATGIVNPVESVEVGTYVSGPIQEILVDFNSPVTKGQLLARIDARPFQVKVQAADAELANTRAALAKAKADRSLRDQTLRRARQLAGQGIVAQSELDAAVSEAAGAAAQVTLAEAAIQGAEARVREARVNLDYTNIASPVDGVVVSRNVSVGQTVAASFQTPTLFLVAADLTKMEVVASVSEADIGGVAVGQEATFTVDAYPRATFAGRVAQVRNAPVTLQNVVTYDVLVSAANDDLRLKPGMTANVAIVTAHVADAVRVPTSALRFRPPANAWTGAHAAPPAPSDHAVWLEERDGSLRPAPVTLGIADEKWTQVTGGVDPGAQVVTAVARDPDVGASRPQLPGFTPGGGGRRR